MRPPFLSQRPCPAPESGAPSKEPGKGWRGPCWRRPGFRLHKDPPAGQPPGLLTRAQSRLPSGNTGAGGRLYCLGRRRSRCWEVKCPSGGCLFSLAGRETQRQPPTRPLSKQPRRRRLACCCAEPSWAVLGPAQATFPPGTLSLPPSLFQLVLGSTGEQGPCGGSPGPGLGWGRRCQMAGLPPSPPTPGPGSSCAPVFLLS